MTETNFDFRAGGFVKMKHKSATKTIKIDFNNAEKEGSGANRYYELYAHDKKVAEVGALMGDRYVIMHKDDSRIRVKISKDLFNKTEIMIKNNMDV